MKKLTLLIILFFNFVLYSQERRAIITFSVSLKTAPTFELYPPIIEHDQYRLKKISKITRIAKIHAKIRDDKKIEKVKLEYGNSYKNLFIKDFDVDKKNYVLNYFIPKDVIDENTEKIYYRISAFDGSNWSFYPSSYSLVEVDVSDKVSLKIKSGRIIFEDGNDLDGETYIFIPEGALDLETEITITEVSTSAVVFFNLDKMDIVKLYKFEPKGIKFKKPVEIGLLYLDLDNDGKIDGTEIDEKICNIFWYDGVNWRILKSNVDIEKNLVICKTNHFTYFALSPLRKSLSKEDYKPKEKIITPNGDGINDIAYFDMIPEGTEIKIFNLQGKIVKTINDPPYEWDGKDENGKELEVGPYIYQFKIDGELISGVIVIAR